MGLRLLLYWTPGVTLQLLCMVRGESDVSSTSQLNPYNLVELDHPPNVVILKQFTE